MEAGELNKECLEQAQTQMRQNRSGSSIELDALDKQIINLIQLDFPLTVHPFESIAEQIGTTEDVVISKLKRLRQEKAIRKIGPVINTRAVGGSNTLAAVKVQAADVEKAAAVISAYPEVSHNYLRNEEYNIWFTVSASTQERLDDVLFEIQDKLKCPLLNLPTIRQFKIQVKFKL
ncbi:Lrp/AsnC family transcriptional regulator [Methanolapillus millepedarum]